MDKAIQFAGLVDRLASNFAGTALVSVAVLASIGAVAALVAGAVERENPAQMVATLGALALCAFYMAGKIGA
jgi:hypothetical protein